MAAWFGILLVFVAAPTTTYNYDNHNYDHIHNNPTCRGGQGSGGNGRHGVWAEAQARAASIESARRAGHNPRPSVGFPRPVPAGPDRRATARVGRTVSGVLFQIASHTRDAAAAAGKVRVRHQ